jgi:isopentenyl diphosphate isomerase/L-lactate dehydrogenase-like FMN-dependent dehydrogenase
MSVDDANLAIKKKIPAIILSNNGSKQLDCSPSSLNIAIEKQEKTPEVFKQVEIYADGSVRHGADVLKLLSLGVKAINWLRPLVHVC